jgi:hypothetical protein
MSFSSYKSFENRLYFLCAHIDKFNLHYLFFCLISFQHKWFIRPIIFFFILYLSICIVWFFYENLKNTRSALNKMYLKLLIKCLEWNFLIILIILLRWLFFNYAFQSIWCYEWGYDYPKCYMLNLKWQVITNPTL